MNPPEPAPRHNRRAHRVCSHTSDPGVTLKTLLSIHAAFSDCPGPSSPIVCVVLLMKLTGSCGDWRRRADYILGLLGPEP